MFWNGNSDDFSEKGRENMRSSTAESTRVSCDVTWDQYQLTFSKEDAVHFLQDSSEAWWEWLHITTKTKRNHILIMKRVLINYKLRSYKSTAQCRVYRLIEYWVYPSSRSTEQIGNTDK